MSQHANTCYHLIENKANSNSLIQGVSGFFGFVATLAVDAGSIPLIYVRLWNEIRAVYGQAPITNEDGIKVLANILPEVLTDILFDKFLGNVPVVGVYFNAVCAKQMTWRLGTLFSMLASRGADITTANCKETMIMIRHMFPQKDMFSFTTPDHSKFIPLVDGVAGCSLESFNRKVDNALAVFTQS